MLYMYAYPSDGYIVHEKYTCVAIKNHLTLTKHYLPDKMCVVYTFILAICPTIEPTAPAEPDAGVIGSDVPWLECPACNALTWVITVTE